MDSTSRSIGRREALKRATILLGGALSAPTIAGVLTGDARLWAVTPDAAWVPRTLTPAQSELVATLAEHIIPATDTPGARAAGVHRFVDALLTDYYADAERDRFLAGLADVDARAGQRHRKSFVKCSRREQLAILTEMDQEAYPPKRSPTDASSRTEAVAPKVRPGWFWRRMKELTLVGYYTSQVGATQELRVNPMGAWRGDIPYRSVGRSWS